MISSDMDKFYQKVLKDFMNNLTKDEYLLKELQHRNIFVNQIEEKMVQKLQNTPLLFKRLTLGYNEIEKEMMSRYATVQEIIYNQRKIRLNSRSNSVNHSSVAQSSNNDDLDQSSQEPSDLQEPAIKEEYCPIQVGKKQQEQSKQLKRKAGSEVSLDDLSQQDDEPANHVKNMRQKAKIHILSTYDQHSKKHDFKHSTTEVMLQNAFIKVEGVGKQIFIKRINCKSRKMTHQ